MGCVFTLLALECWEFWLVMKKLAVGADDFCPRCMDWREFDEGGHCKVCGCHIQKRSQASKSSVEYDLSDFQSSEHEEEPTSGEN